MTIKCPRCEAEITSVNIAAVDGTDPNGKIYRCVLAGCPVCGKALPVDLGAHITADIQRSINTLSARVK